MLERNSALAALQQDPNIDLSAKMFIRDLQTFGSRPTNPRKRRFRPANRRRMGAKPPAVRPARARTLLEGNQGGPEAYRKLRYGKYCVVPEAEIDGWLKEWSSSSLIHLHNTLAAIERGNLMMSSPSINKDDSPKAPNPSKPSSKSATKSTAKPGWPLGARKPELQLQQSWHLMCISWPQFSQSGWKEPKLPSNRSLEEIVLARRDAMAPPYEHIVALWQKTTMEESYDGQDDCLYGKRQQLHSVAPRATSSEPFASQQGPYAPSNVPRYIST
ncbi:MAG: hypothetical protein Q9226_001365 [Calogaya cf. arnoldii]